MPDKIRIRNQYLLMQLASVVRLGSVNVSLQLLVEAWRAAGRQAGDVFFMHHDSLLDCGFLQVSKEPVALAGLEESIAPTEVDVLVSITDTGRDFLDRYGRS